jgi:hypothetical protein
VLVCVVLTMTPAGNSRPLLSHSIWMRRISRWMMEI